MTPPLSTAPGRFVYNREPPRPGALLPPPGSDDLPRATFKQAGLERVRGETTDYVRAVLDAVALRGQHRWVVVDVKVSFAAYQDYDSSRLASQVYVDNPRLSDDAWGRAGFPGECLRNELEHDELDLVADRLAEFSPSLQRTHGIGWCIAFWRDPTAQDGVATEQREHPGFD